MDAISVLSSDLQKRRDSALELKMKSQLIEHQINQTEQMQKALFDYKKLSPELTGLYEKVLGANLADRESGEGLAPLLGLMTAQTSADARVKAAGMRGSGRDSLSGADANKALRAKYFKDDERVTRLSFEAAKNRINAEAGSPTIRNAYGELSAGLKGLRELRKLRQEADKEGYTGPFMGTVGAVGGVASGGKMARKALLLRNRIRLIAPSVAKGSGHVGNLNVPEVEAAVQGIGSGRLIGEVAEEHLNKLEADFVRKMAELERLNPGIKRQLDISDSGMDLPGLFQEESVDNDWEVQ